MAVPHPRRCSGKKIAGIMRGGAIGPFEEWRPPSASIIADTRTLNLNHIGAEIGQYLAGPGTGHHAAEIKNPNVEERSRQSNSLRRFAAPVPISL